MRLLVIITFMFLLAGCARERIARTETTRALSADESRILDIAKRSAREGGSDLSHLEFYTPRRSSDGGWLVLVWALPKVPGGYSVIRIEYIGDRDLLRGCR